MQRSTCHFIGNVQGVGFRYTVMNIAQRYDVVGYVRNVPDGSVEVVMEGEPRECDAMLEDIKQRMEEYIQRVEVNTTPATGEFAQFSLKY